PAAARTGQVELHGSRHLADVARPFALWAGHFAGSGGARSMAGSAGLVARDVYLRLCAPDRLPEIDIHDIFEVAALFRRFLLGLAAPAEKLAEDVPESAAAFGCPAAAALGPFVHVIGEIEAAEIEVLTLRPALAGLRRSVAILGVKAELI